MPVKGIMNVHPNILFHSLLSIVATSTVLVPKHMVLFSYSINMVIIANREQVDKKHRHPTGTVKNISGPPVQKNEHHDTPYANKALETPAKIEGILST